MPLAEVKITVEKRMYNQDLAEKYRPNIKGPCQACADGQEYIVDSLNCPPDFCGWAWSDIHRIVFALQVGGDFDYWTVDRNIMIATCSDAVKPVAFKVERIDEVKINDG